MRLEDPILTSENTLAGPYLVLTGVDALFSRAVGLRVAEVTLFAFVSVDDFVSALATGTLRADRSTFTVGVRFAVLTWVDGPITASCSEMARTATAVPVDPVAVVTLLSTAQDTVTAHRECTRRLEASFTARLTLAAELLLARALSVVADVLRRLLALFPFLSGSSAVRPDEVLELTLESLPAVPFLLLAGLDALLLRGSRRSFSYW